MVRVIKKQLTKRTLDMLTELTKAASPEGDRRSEYELFWESFGKYLKLGIVEDQANRWRPAHGQCITHLSSPTA